MRKIVFISFIIMLFAVNSFAQCGNNEVEIKVNITTDNWGSETSWVIKEIAGNIILEGGQDGVYENNTFYSDSICVAAEGCYYFEIFDTYGDGIIDPNGYELYVDDLLVANGSNDINSYALEEAHCPVNCELIFTALNDLQAHINETTTLTASDLITIKGYFELFPECLVESEAMIQLAKSVVEDFDEEVGALFTTPHTINGVPKDSSVSGFEMEQAMVALQQTIFDHVFSTEVYEDFPDQINDWKFNSCYSFPGYVDPPSDSSISKSVWIRANFEDPDGMNPYFNINSDETPHALRPTGLYLSPGSIASVTVPANLIGHDYYIRVGSHEWDLGIKPSYMRLDRISKKFPIDSTTVTVFNPFGGAISILVPYGAEEGIVEVSVKNGVECPFFSMKSFYTTADFDAELDKPGPWAVFETDNVMFTVPSHTIVPGEYDLMQNMLDWDSAIQGINSIMGRQIISDKHNMYMITDITTRHNVGSIGYPMSNTPIHYMDVPGSPHFIDGPGPNDKINFHESGHARAMSMFPGEGEALVNFPYIIAMNYGLNVELNEAVKHSYGTNTFNIDKTATHRMVSNSFGGARVIVDTTANEVRYQHRGYGHYSELVNLFGWCPIRNFWRQEFIDFENGIDHGLNNQDIDDRIIRMSVAAQADLRPLFHVFGILPQDNTTIQTALNQMDIQPSFAMYNRLQEYFELIPEDNDAYVDFALSLYPNLYLEGPNENPDYGVGWHYQKSLTYNAAEAQQRTETLQSIVDLYFPNGEPINNGIIDVCCTLEPINVTIENDEVIVTGGVKPYHISTETTVDVQTVTVVDFDGCESIVQSTLSVSDFSEVEEKIKIYPTPASTEISIEIADTGIEIVSLQMVSISGQVVSYDQKFDHVLDISKLSNGMYILQIELESGAKVNKRVLVLK